MDEGSILGDQNPVPDGSAAELVHRIRAGDRRAEEQLVERFSHGLSLMLRRLARDPYLADDLHQETFRLVIEKVRGSELREPDRLAGFIRSTARNLFIADRRKQARYADVEEVEALVERQRPEPAEPHAPQLHQLLQAEEARLVRKLLGELRFERDRQLLVRFYLSDDTTATICRDLDVDPERFNRVIFRARQRLRELWERSEKRQRLFTDDR